MAPLNIAENILRFRHGKKMTQEQLANFIGVTKASVSKWETGQSMPDIIILPQLAAIFDVTVDEILGYVPQLSPEQIQKLYQEFAADFASRPFEEVLAQTQKYVKKYYSCYPFLFQICVLWLNHHTMAKGEERQREILAQLSDLCGHIRENCHDVRISDDVIVLQSMVHLLLGKTDEVVDALEEMSRPDRLMGQSASVLMQAYMMAGEKEKAESLMQISMYNALVSFVGISTSYISMQMEKPEACEPTVNRIAQVVETYGLRQLNPNLAAGFEYQATMYFCLHGKKQEALEHAGYYVLCLEELFSSDTIVLHGDDYFDRIEEWFEKTEGGTGALRNRQVVLDEVKSSLDSPAFALLEREDGFKNLKRKLSKIC